MVEFVGKYSRLPTDAVEFMKEHTSENAEYVKKPVRIKAGKLKDDLVVKSLEGEVLGQKGDYLVVGVRGELYPVRADIFKQTYDKV